MQLHSDVQAHHKLAANVLTKLVAFRDRRLGFSCGDFLHVQSGVAGHYLPCLHCIIGYYSFRTHNK
jgi:hypothetical protein